MKVEFMRGVVLGLAVLVSGCASFQAQRGVSETAGLAAARGVSPASLAVTADCRSLRSALGADAGVLPTIEQAVQVALACNPALAAQYARLGIANAEVFDARRLANPSLSVGVADSNAGSGGTKLNLGIAQNFTRLILRGPRTRLAEGEFLRAQQLLAGSVLELAADVNAAWFGWIGAQQVAAARAAIAEAADASAELASRFHAAGNISAREWALRQASAVEARIAVREARQQVVSARVALQRVLGVVEFEPAAEPDAIDGPPAVEEALDALRAQADAQRLDLAATRQLVELLADSAATTRRLRWLGEFEVGVEYEREPDHSRLIGPTLSIQLPLFHQGQGALARAQSAHAWSEAERRRLTLEVASAVELASARVHAARARIDDHRLHLLPQRAAVVARMQEEFNYMLRGAFELIDARIAEYHAAEGYFDALRAYWIARSELERAVGRRLPVQATAAVRTAEVLGSVYRGEHEEMDHSKDHSKMDHSKMDHSEMDPSEMDHSKMDHSKMDHSKMDHSKMDHSKMDHSKMDHSRMDHSKVDPPEPRDPAGTPATPAHRNQDQGPDRSTRGEQP